jgi:catechol 2,3-dioxygenase-like lactoylglutathione lyase family enzyme
MVSGGNATVFVSNMDAAVRFYTEVLGLKLLERHGDHWATVDAGRGFVIGLHPPSPKYAAPGTKGGILLGLEIDEPIEGFLGRLKAKSVKVGPIVRDAPSAFADCEDPDGNPFYLWETPRQAAPEAQPAHSAS